MIHFQIVSTAIFSSSLISFAKSNLLLIHLTYNFYIYKVGFGILMSFLTLHLNKLCLFYIISFADFNICVNFS